MKTENGKLNVCVLAGGISSERMISLQSGKSVATALQQAGFNVSISDIRPDNLSTLEDTEIDVFFIALHGEFGEDGQLQQILEDRLLCYIGSSPQTCRLAFDKMASKEAFRKVGVNVPAGIEFTADTDITRLEEQLHQFTGKYYVVKPVSQGSSVGVNIISGISEAIASAQKCFDEFGNCMIEKFISGREITVGVLCGEPLPIIEIKPKEGFYNYLAKYFDDNTEYLFDTIDDTLLVSTIKRQALDCFNTLGCRDFARVDFILSDDNIAYALEVNSIPGFTTHSCLPKAASKAGVPMSKLCEKIVYAALTRKQGTFHKITAIATNGQKKDKKQIKETIA